MLARSVLRERAGWPCPRPTARLGLSSPRRFALLVLEGFELGVDVDDRALDVVGLAGRRWAARLACADWSFVAMIVSSSWLCDAARSRRSSRSTLAVGRDVARRRSSSPSRTRPLSAARVAPVGSGPRRRASLARELVELRLERRIVVAAAPRAAPAAARGARGASCRARAASSPLRLLASSSALLVELERVRVGLHADLDRPAGLVGVDVVERGVGRLARSR